MTRMKTTMKEKTQLQMKFFLLLNTDYGQSHFVVHLKILEEYRRLQRLSARLEKRKDDLQSSVRLHKQCKYHLSIDFFVPFCFFLSFFSLSFSLSLSFLSIIVYFFIATDEKRACTGMSYVLTLMIRRPFILTHFLSLSLFLFRTRFFFILVLTNAFICSEQRRLQHILLFKVHRCTYSTTAQLDLYECPLRKDKKLI